MKYQCEFTKVGKKLLNYFLYLLAWGGGGARRLYLDTHVNDSVYCCCFVRLFLLMSPSHYIVPCGINKLLLN